MKYAISKVCQFGSQLESQNSFQHVHENSGRFTCFKLTNHDKFSAKLSTICRNKSLQSSIHHSIQFHGMEINMYFGCVFIFVAEREVLITYKLSQGE